VRREGESAAHSAPRGAQLSLSRAPAPTTFSLSLSLSLYVQACVPANYARVHAKPRCPVPGCRTALSLVNAYDCKGCGSRVCLAHRHATDHGCAAAARAAAAGAAARRPGLAGAWARLKRTLSGGDGGGTGAGAPSSSGQAAAAASAAVRLAGQPPPPPSRSPRSAAGTAAERRAAARAATLACPVCGLGCGSAKAVRAHHTAAHPGAAPLPACVLS